MANASTNLGRCFDAARSPDKTAVIDLRDFGAPASRPPTPRSTRSATPSRAGFSPSGLKPGDRVGILSLNRIELLAAYFGIMRAGLVAVPISFKLPRETVDYIVKDADLRAVFFDRDRAALCPADVLRIGFDEPSGYASLRDPGPFETFEPKARELAMILYTSGSTGKPKGVLLSHESQRWSLEKSKELYDDRSHHRYIVAAPMFHMNATISVKGALSTGASIVLLPAFDAALYARAIARFKVTWLTSVPTMLALVARERDLLESLDFSSVTNVTMGSAPLTQALVDKVQAHLSQGGHQQQLRHDRGRPGPVRAAPGRACPARRRRSAIPFPARRPSCARGQVRTRAFSTCRARC